MVYYVFTFTVFVLLTRKAFDMAIFNRTRFENIGKLISSDLTEIKRGRSNWRQRDIVLYDHPLSTERLISVGTMNNGDRVIADELKSDWSRELGQAGNFVTN